MAEPEKSIDSEKETEKPTTKIEDELVSGKDNLEKGSDKSTTPDVPKSPEHEIEKHGGPESEYESAEEEDLNENDSKVDKDSEASQSKLDLNKPSSPSPEVVPKNNNDSETQNTTVKVESETQQNNAENNIIAEKQQQNNADSTVKVEEHQNNAENTVKVEKQQNSPENTVANEIDSKMNSKSNDALINEPLSTEKLIALSDVVKNERVEDKLALEKLSIKEDKLVEVEAKPTELKHSQEESANVTNEKVNELAKQISNLTTNPEQKNDVSNLSKDKLVDGESLGEFLDNSGEAQGDLLDEEGHEGGMEEQAELGEEFPDDENVLLDDEDVDFDKHVTIEYGTEPIVDYGSVNRDINSPNEKNYIQEDGEYDEEEETLDDEDDGEEYVEGEREQGDGEESVSPTPNKEKVLDDDEDRRNPQYIPKKGAFYEHDDRLMSDQEQVEEEKEPEVVETEKQELKKKKLWQEDGRWNHDMFNQDEQAPKSRDELLNSYGYDIRTEDCAPRARRRRRYGRGPNKYTRNWKDEDAYHKGGSESGQESESDGRKGSFRQPARRGRKNERGARRGKGRVNNRRRGTDNASEDDDGEEHFDGGTPHQDYADNKKNNNEPPASILDKDFPPLMSVTNNPIKSTETEKDRTKDSNIMNFRGTKAPFPPAQQQQQQTLKSPSVEKEEMDKAQGVRTLTFENSRYNNNRRNSNEMKPNTMREEERMEHQPPPRNFDRGPQRPPGRGRGRGRDNFNNAVKGKGDNYNQRPNGRGYTVDKNRSERPYRPNYHHQRNQFMDDVPARPKSREEEINQIMNEIPPPKMDEVIMPHNLKSHAENRPKRYSSLRQSRAPDGNPPQSSGNFRQNQPPPRHSHSQNQQYYEKPNNYKAAPVYPDRMSGSNNPPVNHNNAVNPMITGSPMYPTYNTPYQEPSFAMRPSLSNAPPPPPPQMYPPPTAQPVALTPPYLQQGPQTNPAAAAAIINYLPGPNPHPPPTMMGPPSGMHQYPYQQYNGPPPTSSPPIVTPAGPMGPAAAAAVLVSQPQEVYRGGVTYYNTQSQQLLPVRMNPQRRAKAAIPIVDPTQDGQSSIRGSYQSGRITAAKEESAIAADGTRIRPQPPTPSSNKMPVET